MRETVRTERGLQMAELAVEGDELVLHLTRVEKLEAVHRDLRAPRAAVRSIEVLEDTPRGVRIEFDGTDFDAWIVGSPDPEALKTRIEQG